MRCAALVLALAACRDVGTIAITLPPLGSCDAGTAIETHFVVVFAEPTHCDACMAGACFGLKEAGQVIDCDGPDPCTEAELHGETLHLAPGHWAVVVEALDDERRVLATACADVEVDVDGTADKAVDDLALVCVP